MADNLENKRVTKKPAPYFDGFLHQEDEVIVYGNSCRYCNAPEGARHCHILFEGKQHT